jgi:hypothetical protein
MLFWFSLFSYMCAAFGGTSEPHPISENLLNDFSHQKHGRFATAFSKVRENLTTKLGGHCNPVEYSQQVVQGMKYLVKCTNDQGETYMVHIWQKPLNSVDNILPEPEIVKTEKISSKEL